MAASFIINIIKIPGLNLPIGSVSLLIAGAFFILYPNQPAYAQTYPSEEITTNPFDRPVWEKTIEGLDYSSSKTKKSREKSSHSRPSAAENEKDTSRNNFKLDNPWLSAAAKILLIALGIFVFFILLRALLGLEWKLGNRKIDRQEELTGIDLEKIEENIEAFDLEAYLQKALEAGKYDLAIRLFYLAVLKELSNRNFLNWKKGKTNYDYLRELRSSPYHENFRRLTLIFERVWYGERPVTQEDYSKAAPHFRRFLDSLPPVTEVPQKPEYEMEK